MDLRYSLSLGQYIASVLVTAEEARFIADLIPFEDAASQEWDYIARTLGEHNKAWEEAYE